MAKVQGRSRRENADRCTARKVTNKHLIDSTNVVMYLYLHVCIYNNQKKAITVRRRRRITVTVILSHTNKDKAKASSRPGLQKRGSLGLFPARRARLQQDAACGHSETGFGHSSPRLQYPLVKEYSF